MMTRDVFKELGNILDPNRCESCILMESGRNTTICRANGKPIPDITGQPIWCPKKKTL